jgi:hypothetical protein
VNAVIFDIEQVCAIAEQYVKAEGLSERISTRVGDMWRDSLPAADLHFYSNIYHDWPPEKCSFLTRKSFDALPPGGRLVVHEMLYDDDKKGRWRLLSIPLPSFVDRGQAVFWKRADRNAQ